MANDLIKAIIKGVTVLVAGGFTAKVGSEGTKNFNAWREKQKSQSISNKN